MRSDVTFVTTRDGEVTEGPNEAEKTRGERPGAAHTLHKHGGVGAILRFRLDEARAIPDLQ